LKYRLETRYKNVSLDELLFPEHQQLGKGVNFEAETEYEELLGYLRKKNDDRRLTSLDQSKDNKINKSIRILEISEGAIAEGSTPQAE
jgi:hypothetical protein